MRERILNSLHVRCQTVSELAGKFTKGDIAKLEGFLIPLKRAGEVRTYDFRGVVLVALTDEGARRL